MVQRRVPEASSTRVMTLTEEFTPNVSLPRILAAESDREAAARRPTTSVMPTGTAHVSRSKPFAEVRRNCK